MWGVDLRFSLGVRKAERGIQYLRGPFHTEKEGVGDGRVRTVTETVGYSPGVVAKSIYYFKIPAPTGNLQLQVSPLSTRHYASTGVGTLSRDKWTGWVIHGWKVHPRHGGGRPIVTVIGPSDRQETSGV